MARDAYWASLFPEIVNDDYWASLFSEAAGAVGAAAPAGPIGAGVAAKAAKAGKGGISKKLKELLKDKNVRKGAASILVWMALDKMINAGNEWGNRNVQREALQAQGASMTPENLYYQAALPSAQAEEDQARQALFGQLSGGVLGPTLARGERLI